MHTPILAHGAAKLAFFVHPLSSSFSLTLLPLALSPLSFDHFLFYFIPHEGGGGRGNPRHRPRGRRYACGVLRCGGGRQDHQGGEHQHSGTSTTGFWVSADQPPVCTATTYSGTRFVPAARTHSSSNKVPMHTRLPSWRLCVRQLLCARVRAYGGSMFVPCRRRMSPPACWESDWG